MLPIGKMCLLRIWVICPKCQRLDKIMAKWYYVCNIQTHEKHLVHSLVTKFTLGTKQAILNYTFTVLTIRPDSVGYQPLLG